MSSNNSSGPWGHSPYFAQQQHANAAGLERTPSQPSVTAPVQGPLTSQPPNNYRSPVPRTSSQPQVMPPFHHQNAPRGSPVAARGYLPPGRPNPVQHPPPQPMGLGSRQVSVGGSAVPLRMHNPNMIDSTLARAHSAPIHPQQRMAETYNLASYGPRPATSIEEQNHGIRLVPPQSMHPQQNIRQPQQPQTNRPTKLRVANRGSARAPPNLGGANGSASGMSSPAVTPSPSPANPLVNPSVPVSTVRPLNPPAIPSTTFPATTSASPLAANTSARSRKRAAGEETADLPPKKKTQTEMSRSGTEVTLTRPRPLESLSTSSLPSTSKTDPVDTPLGRHIYQRNVMATGEYIAKVFQDGHIELEDFHNNAMIGRCKEMGIDLDKWFRKPAETGRTVSGWEFYNR